MKIYEITETIIRGETNSRHIHYDPLYKGLENFNGKLLMNDADAIEALLYPAIAMDTEEVAFRDLLIRKYKITRDTDIGALVKKIRDDLEAKNRQHVKDRDADNAKYDDDGNLIGETATAMGASSIASVSGNLGPIQSRNMYNADGTMKNGLEFANLLGGGPKPKKKKKTRKNA